MQAIKIEKATKKDYAALLKLYEEFTDHPGKYSNKKNDSFLKLLKDPNFHIDLAKRNKEIAGFITYSIRHVVRYREPILEVEEFFVKSSHRRKGIGRLLITNVKNFAKKKKCQQIFVASAKERDIAHVFYKATGFKEYGLHYRASQQDL